MTHRKVSWDHPFLVHSASRNPRGRWDQRRAFGTSFPVSLWGLNIEGLRKDRWKEKGTKTAMTLQSSTKGWLLPFSVLLNPECRGWGRAVCGLSTQKLDAFADTLGKTSVLRGHWKPGLKDDRHRSRAPPYSTCSRWSAGAQKT